MSLGVKFPVDTWLGGFCPRTVDSIKYNIMYRKHVLHFQFVYCMPKF